MVNKSEMDYFANRGDRSGLELIVIINCALNASLMPISIIGNTLVLVAILRTPSLRSPSTVFICSLAVSDLLIGLVVQPVYIANEIRNDQLYTIRNIAAFYACAVSLFTVTAISVDRFLALHYHMRYPNLMTTRRAMYTSASLWFTSFPFTFSFLDKKAYYLVAAIGICICLILSTVCYIRIFRIVRQHQLQIHLQHQAVEGLNYENNQNMQRSKRSALNTFIYHIVMLLCFTPLFIFSIMLRTSHVPKWWIIADSVAFMNSSINPFLYCWRVRELRMAVVKTARKVLCKQTEGS